MKEISYSEFSKLGRKGVRAAIPTILTFDGEPIGVVCSLDGFIIIEDLHPRVQQQLKAREKLARGGMKSGEKVYADMFKTSEKPMI